MQDQPRPLWAHLEELRRRLVWSALAVVIGGALAGYFFEPLVRLLLAPSGGLLSGAGKPVYTEVTEILGVWMKVAILGGIVCGLPIFIYQIAMFVAPALNPRERRLALLFIPSAFFCFAGGVAFSYFILLPPAFQFLLTFGSDIAQPMIRISNYVNLVITLLIWTGLIFETPLVMVLLARLRIVNYKTFGRMRRWVFVGAFVLGAIITPTFDPLNQTFVALPVFVLYEIGIWLSWLVRPRDKKPSNKT
ncbi:MAG: twin-arginine translocase subunit TatC [Dehalococcoidia bacterium]|nr:twin-arginine translocase subunit TatC [Dehalococcoidia bacterium]